MTSLIYDGTFGGFLTAVFEVYERKLGDVHIYRPAHSQPDAFAETVTISSDAAKAKRVWDGLNKKLPGGGISKIYYSFLSEIQGVEDVLLQYIRYAFASAEKIEGDFGNATVLQVAQITKKVAREKHRMEAFVRFQLMKGDIFYAAIEPDFNVLPLITKHFKSRYADQNWLIYDILRKYGIYYDKYESACREVIIEWKEGTTAATQPKDVFEPKEELYQLLWKDYFKHTGIPARKNLKLHIQHVPRRYWKYLTEKQLV